MVGPPRVLRFAVGTFASWQELDNALHDLRLRGVAPDSFNCLALERALAENSASAVVANCAGTQRLAFPDNHEAMACTSGVLADLLDARFRSGAQSLREALGCWLIARHATHFEGVVEAGKILIWVRLGSPDEERCACQSLLASSSHSVGVHDLSVR